MSNRVPVRLIRKLAQYIDGIDLGSRRVGDVFEASLSDARLLVAEGWATVASESPLPPEPPGSGPSRPTDTALD
jgi:hypothetical protein